MRETDLERDRRFREGNDRIWGPGAIRGGDPTNWYRCPTCPLDHTGRQVYHHLLAHGRTPCTTVDLIRMRFGIPLRVRVAIEWFCPHCLTWTPRKHWSRTRGAWWCIKAE